VNLVANTGFGADATNTTGKGGCWIASRPAGEIAFPLIHASFIARDRAAELYTFEHVYPGARLRKELCWKYRLRKKLWLLKQRLTGG